MMGINVSYTATVKRLAILALVCGVSVSLTAAQRTTKKPAPKPAVPTLAPATLNCPSPLGTGVTSKREFCDVPIGRTPADGITINLPPHKGAATLIFDLHNRVVYSEELVRAKRSYALTTATIGVLTLDNTLISRAVVQNEFRAAADLYDRIGGGAGPGGLKAVAPSGLENVRLAVPEGITDVCVLGEKLVVNRFEGNETFTAPGRPIALISNVMIEYQPLPVKKAPAKAPAKKPAKGAR
jgi:hypothetical protein